MYEAPKPPNAEHGVAQEAAVQPCESRLQVLSCAASALSDTLYTFDMHHETLTFSVVVYTNSSTVDAVFVRKV